MSKKNIIHIFGSMNYGGAELRTIQLMDILVDTFENIYFCTTSGKEGELAHSLKKKGYKVIPCNIYSILFPFRFIKLLKENEIDIVHSHISVVSGYIVLLAFLAKVKSRIVHFRSAKNDRQSPIIKKLKYRLFKQLVEFFSTEIIAVNKYTMISHFSRYESMKKCIVLYNGISNIYDDNSISIATTKKELLIENNIKVITHIGRFDKPKNHEKIIKIFCQYSKINPLSVLLLIGNDNTLIGEKIKEKIKKNNIEPQVIVLGIQNDVTKYLAISDALLFPSLWEGLPGVVLESLSAGVPVLCSDIGCHVEISKTNMGIYLQSLEDDEKIWAQSLDEIAKKGKQWSIANSFIKSPYIIQNTTRDFINFYVRLSTY